ncbi:hypothetical protein HU200_064159 [Digitaria exilis]|uniref:F-box domain-containing protein n=1 Tax=Digitaria exilis TaxID=1010633 RepID=A0A835DVR8_9POAL|nr:hypothetical protein HU200_064159 [Digitaria exilis]
MGVRGCRRQQRRRAGGIDHLSDLSDDLLVRVLELLPDTRDAVRTGALSRRWRGLWTRVPSLRLISGGKRRFRGARGAKRFLALVDDHLRHRDHKAAALDHLTISFAMDPAGQQARQQLRSRSIEAAQRWIFYASRIGVKSLDLDLTLPLSDYRRLYFFR